MAYNAAPVRGSFNVRITLNNGRGYSYIPFATQQQAIANVQRYGHGVVFDPSNRQVYAQGGAGYAQQSTYQAPAQAAVPGSSSTGYWQVWTADRRRSMKYTSAQLAAQNLARNPGGRVAANVSAPDSRWRHMLNQPLS